MSQEEIYLQSSRHHDDFLKTLVLHKNCEQRQFDQIENIDMKSEDHTLLVFVHSGGCICQLYFKYQSEK